jgi:glycosyltransferase involved in cell wall biosynthesis
MHVMHVIDSLSVGGAERMLVDIANATKEDGHSVSVCVTREGRDLAGDLNPDTPLYILGRRRRFELPAMKRFATLTRESEIDVVHAHSRSTFSFLLFARSLRFTNAPIVLHDHFGEIEINTSVPNWFRWYGHRHLEQYVGVSQELTDWACRAGVDRSRVRTIGNALDLSRVFKSRKCDPHTEFGTRKDARIGVVVCGIRREKGVQVFLEALGRCRSRERTQILVVGGDRDSMYAAECRAKAKSLGLNGMVFFVGERRDAMSIIRGADFGVVPSLSESGPLVLIEYLASGLPVVATRCGDIAHRAEACGVEGFVTPGDPATLAEALDDLLSLSSANFRRRSEFSAKVARENFEIRKTMVMWYDVYDAALRGGHS